MALARTAGTSLVVICGLVLAGCGHTGGDTAGVVATDFAGCAVASEGGYQDYSLNQGVAQGLDAAGQSSDIKIEKIYSHGASEYEPNMRSAIQSGCDFIVAVGSPLAGITEEVAGDYPNVRFLVVDAKTPRVDNVKSVTYEMHEASFVAGYAAAAASGSDTVAIYGGQKNSTTTGFMDGFFDGVEYYNENNDSNIEILGWDKNSQEGEFIDSLTDVDAAESVTEDFINDGADVVVPVAGYAGVGTIQVISRENQGGGGDVVFIWSDLNGDSILPDDYKKYHLTSVVKNTSDPILSDLQKAASGEFDHSPYVGNLKNGGVDVGNFNERQKNLSQDELKDIQQLRQRIIDGDILVESKKSTS